MTLWRGGDMARSAGGPRFCADAGPAADRRTGARLGSKSGSIWTPCIGARFRRRRRYRAFSCCTASRAPAKPKSTCAPLSVRWRRDGRRLCMVPEISLTPQTVRRFAARFPGRVSRRPQRTHRRRTLRYVAARPLGRYSDRGRRAFGAVHAAAGCRAGDSGRGTRRQLQTVAAHPAAVLSHARNGDRS